MPSPVDVMVLQERITRQSATRYREGSLLYESARQSQAAQTWEQSALAAEAGGRTRQAAESRFWQGVALHGAGRLRQAMAALGMVATYVDARAVDERTRHMSLSRAVLIGVDLPASLESIERAIHEVERIENHTGKGRTARILLVRARLAQARGDAGLALQFAREGLARAGIEDAGFARGTYIKEALRACLHLGALDEAEHLVAQLASVADAYAVSRNIIAAAFRSMIARARGDVAAAIEQGGRAFEISQQSDEIQDRMLATEAFVRSLLCTDHPQNARAPLARELRLRHSQAGAVRYEARLLRGDFHMAMMRVHAGLPALDPETGRTFGVPEGKTEVLANAHRRRAHDAWRAALRVGRAMDTRLQCRVRESQLAGRRRLLDSPDSATPLHPYIDARDPALVPEGMATSSSL